MRPLHQLCLGDYLIYLLVGLGVLVVVLGCALVWVTRRACPALPATSEVSTIPRRSSIQIIGKLRKVVCKANPVLAAKFTQFSPTLEPSS